MDDQNKSMNERWAPPPQKTERGYAGESGYRPGEQGAPSSDEALGESVARTREIRSEIDQTRDDISETIDAIQDRLAPRNVASRAAGSVREATMGKVRQMAHQVQDRMPSFGNDYSGNGIMDRIRENPVPTAIAAASLAWIAFGSRRRSHSHEFGQAIYGSTRGGEPYVRETRIDLGEGESHAWSGAGTQWSGRDYESTHRTAEQMRAAQRRARRVADENPFAAGAIAAAVGLAIGLAIPETEREDELMGEAKESLMERGRETVRERVQNAASQVQRVAGEALTGGTQSGEGNKPKGS